MKTFILPLLRITHLSLAAALWCLPGHLPAAEGASKPPSVTPEPKPAGYDLQIVDGHLICPGGKVEATLPNVIDALRDQYTEANIVLSPRLTKLKVSDLKLRAGLLAEELEAVRVASGERFEVQRTGTTSPSIDPTTGLPLGGNRTINAGLFVLHEVPPPGQRQRVVEAFNVGPYLDWLRHRPKENGLNGQEEDYGLEQIEKIMLDTLKGFNSDASEVDQPSFQYHRGASLLVVIGNVDSVEIARKIVNALPGMGSGGEESGARFGVEGAPRFQQPANRAADAAFRKRYGLPPASGNPRQPGTEPTDAGAAK